MKLATLVTLGFLGGLISGRLYEHHQLPVAKVVVGQYTFYCLQGHSCYDGTWDVTANKPAPAAQR